MCRSALQQCDLRVRDAAPTTAAAIPMPRKKSAVVTSPYTAKKKRHSNLPDTVDLSPFPRSSCLVRVSLRRQKQSQFFAARQAQVASLPCAGVTDMWFSTRVLLSCHRSRLAQAPKLDPCLRSHISIRFLHATFRKITVVYKPCCHLTFSQEAQSLFFSQDHCQP